MVLIKYVFVAILTVCSLLNAASQKPVVFDPQVADHRLVCPPCDEPYPGTALWHYMKGIEELTGLKTNTFLANEHFKRAADMDYAPAIKALADSYYSGDGIDQDRDIALLLYRRAADLGDGSAQFNAGVILLRGYAGIQDFELAFYYLCLATMNEGLDEMAQDAAVYRDEAGALLTPSQTQAVYRRLINNPSLKPHKRKKSPGVVN
jgi:TPR repeat protein